jgi:UDP-2,3-diacylglucosamine hydrolase
MTTLLISDLHLDQQRPGMVEALEALLAGPARNARALYILGDLFEAWIGDDDPSELALQVAHALARLSDHGVDCAFLHGNRDFLLGEGFAGRAGMRLLPEAVVERIEGVPTLLMHGDTLCTNDEAYLKFRAQVREPGWQAAFLAQPFAARTAFAAQARVESARHTGTTAPVLMDVTPEAVVEQMRVHGVRRLIHGHTHRPGVHAFALDGDHAERIVLADWYDRGSYLQIDGDGVKQIVIG